MKMKSESLPKITKKKKIDIDKFEKLAMRVKKYFEEEEKYMERVRKNGNSNSSGFLPNS